MSQDLNAGPVILIMDDVEEILRLIPECRIEPVELLDRINEALDKYAYLSRLSAALRRSDFRRMKQALEAARKFQRLWCDPTVLSDEIRSGIRAFVLKGPSEVKKPIREMLRIRRAGRFSKDLDRIVRGLEAASMVPPERLWFFEDTLFVLVMLLAQIYVDATGKPMSTPSYNETRDPPFSDEFVLFLTYFEVATRPVFKGKARPLDEKIRGKLRTALEDGSVPKKEEAAT